MYKNKEAQRAAVRRAVKRHRQGITSEGKCNTHVIPFSTGITYPRIVVVDGQEMVQRRQVKGLIGYAYLGDVETVPRYLTLSDGQTLDRASLPV